MGEVKSKCVIVWSDFMTKFSKKCNISYFTNGYILIYFVESTIEI